MNQLTMDKTRRKEIFILALCLLIGFVLRFYTFDKKSLWIDEVYTFNESRYELKDQSIHYKENPTYLQPPLFYLLTHLFYPFTKPERDLRIIPLIFGTLSIPMIYLLSRLFSPPIALPCTLSLTFMTYHISLSQDGRSYSLLMFLGMAAIGFLMKHLKTSKKRYLILAAIVFGISFYTSYTFVLFIAISQIFWFYQPGGEPKKPILNSFLFLNGLILLFCVPWIIFGFFSYGSQPLLKSVRGDGNLDSFFNIISNIIHDWAPFPPLMVTSVILLVLLPFFSKLRKNSVILLTVFVLPVVGLYLFFKIFNITHFVTSRYFINCLPFFLITLYLSLDAIEIKFERLRKLLCLKPLFIILFAASNLLILPFYYQSEKQDLRGLTTYLKAHLREGDSIFDTGGGHVPGILYYFGIYPGGRHYIAHFNNEAGKGIEFHISFSYQNKMFTIYSSNTCCAQYVSDGRRLWIIARKEEAKSIKENNPFLLKAYFDGTFFNFNRFPTDASIYLFLWDPKSPDEKGIDMPIE